MPILLALPFAQLLSGSLAMRQCVRRRPDRPALSGYRPLCHIRGFRNESPVVCAFPSALYFADSRPCLLLNRVDAPFPTVEPYS